MSGPEASGDARPGTARCSSGPSTSRSTSRSARGSCSARWRGCTPWTTSASRCAPGRRSGLVGESGCGKSTLARCIARLYDLTGGSITFEGRDISRLSRRQLRPVRRELQMVFQDPYASLNPRKRVGTIISDPLRIHHYGDRAKIKDRVRELLELVGLSPEHVNRYPHEFSGGQRQRIGVARAHRAAPQADHRRRAGLRPGRLDPRAGDQPAGRPAGRARPHVRVHRPRPGRGAAHLRPDRGHVPGQDRRDLARRGAVPAPGPPLHRGPAVGGPDPRSGPVGPAGADRAGGRRAQPGGAAVGVPLPPALPVRHRDLRARGAAAGASTGAAGTWPPAITRWTWPSRPRCRGRPRPRP